MLNNSKMSRVSILALSLSACFLSSQALATEVMDENYSPNSPNRQTVGKTVSFSDFEKLKAENVRLHLEVEAGKQAHSKTLGETIDLITKLQEAYKLVKAVDEANQALGARYAEIAAELRTSEGEIVILKEQLVTSQALVTRGRRKNEILISLMNAYLGLGRYVVQMVVHNRLEEGSETPELHIILSPSKGKVRTIGRALARKMIKSGELALVEAHQ